MVVFLRFCSRNFGLQWVPFGLLLSFVGEVWSFHSRPSLSASLSLWVFTHITKKLALHLRSRGTRLRTYVNDWLILANSSFLCRFHLHEILSLSSSLGFLPNWKNSDLSPSQRFHFLGMVLTQLCRLHKRLYSESSEHAGLSLHPWESPISLGQRFLSYTRQWTYLPCCPRAFP